MPSQLKIRVHEAIDHYSELSTGTVSALAQILDHVASISRSGGIAGRTGGYDTDGCLVRLLRSPHQSNKDYATQTIDQAIEALKKAKTLVRKVKVTQD